VLGFPSSSQAADLHVGPSDTIQAAVDRASSGDVIHIAGSIPAGINAFVELSSQQLLLPESGSATCDGESFRRP
jgi:hypothetical protein